MIPESLPAPIWIGTPAALKRMAADLSTRKQVAVDTESNGLHAYQEQVCLLQFSSEETDYLVDPLVLNDLSPLEPLFNDPAIEKIFHAAEYDIICLKRDFGFRFNNLFDTMQAARILGRKELGLGHLLGTEYGLEIDKHYQRANWGRRPLPIAMQTYARLDSHYLIALSGKLRGELAQRDLLALADEDFKRLCNIPGAPLDVAHDSCWKVAGNQDLEPREAAILQALCDFRNQQARYSNVPAFRIIQNSVLLEIAHAAPQSLEELNLIGGISDLMYERYGIGLLAAVEKGMHAHPPHQPHNHKPSQIFLRRVEDLRKWRRDVGVELGVESDVVLPRDVLVALAEVNPSTMEDVEQVMETLPWRYQRYGTQILKVLGQRGIKD